MRANTLVHEKSFHVLDSLIALFEAHGLESPLAPMAIACVQSWLRYSRFENAEYFKSRPSLIALLFQGLNSGDLFDTCVDAICDLFYITSEIPEFFDVIVEIYKGLCSVYPLVSSRKVTTTAAKCILKTNMF